MLYIKSNLDWVCGSCMWMTHKEDSKIFFILVASHIVLSRTKYLSMKEGNLFCFVVMRSTKPDASIKQNITP
jgi:hypothetical protein